MGLLSICSRHPLPCGTLSVLIFTVMLRAIATALDFTFSTLLKILLQFQFLAFPEFLLFLAFSFSYNTFAVGTLASCNFS
jgi:hypothetical protein